LIETIQSQPAGLQEEEEINKLCTKHKRYFKHSASISCVKKHKIGDIKKDMTWELPPLRHSAASVRLPARHGPWRRLSAAHGSEGNVISDQKAAEQVQIAFVGKN